MDYAFKHEGKAFTPNQTKVDPANVEAHNARIEAEELAEWSKAPDRFAVYIVKRENQGYVATTWTGKQLSTGRVAISRYTNNLGKRIECVRFTGTNGAEYYGRYGADWSQLCRVRKCKS